ncbi:hypothetical protein V1478_010814, partial [Vespula squamosa]
NFRGLFLDQPWLVAASEVQRNESTGLEGAIIPVIREKRGKRMSSVPLHALGRLPHAEFQTSTTTTHSNPSFLASSTDRLCPDDSTNTGFKGLLPTRDRTTLILPIVFPIELLRDSERNYPKDIR